MRLYLASRSPRRRELLHQMGINFDTLVFRDGGRADFEIDETPRPGEDPLVYVERVARAKSSTVKRSSMNASCHNARFFPPIPRWNLPGRLSASRLMRPMQPPFCSDYPGKRIVF